MSFQREMQYFALFIFAVCALKNAGIIKREGTNIRRERMRFRREMQYITLFLSAACALKNAWAKKNVKVPIFNVNV